MNVQLSNKQQLISNTVKISESSIHSSTHGDLSQLIQDFNDMNTKDLESNKQIISKTLKNNFNVIIDEIINFDNEKQKILNHLNNHNVTLDEIYNWLLNNQDNSNSIVVLGDFNFLGIGTSIDAQ